VPHSFFWVCWHTRDDIRRVYIPPQHPPAGSKNRPRSFAPSSKSFGGGGALGVWLRWSVSYGAVALEIFFHFFFWLGVWFAFMLPFVCESSAGFAGVSSVCSCWNTFETFAAMLRNTTERERERQTHTHTHTILQSTWSFQQLLLKNSRKSCYSSAPFS